MVTVNSFYYHNNYNDFNHNITHVAVPTGRNVRNARSNPNQFMRTKDDSVDHKLIEMLLKNYDKNIRPPPSDITGKFIKLK